MRMYTSKKDNEEEMKENMRKNFHCNTHPISSIGMGPQIKRISNICILAKFLNLSVCFKKKFRDHKCVKFLEYNTETDS